MTIGRWAAAAAILGIAGGAAQAQGFEGAEVSAEVLAYADDMDLGETQYRGAVQLGLGAGIGVAADLSWHGFRGLDLDGRNLTLHGIYQGWGPATLGAFYARDRIEDSEADLFGVEAAAMLGGLDLEGAFGFANSDGDDGTLIVADARYGFGGFAATGGIGRFTGDLDATRLSVGGEYALGFGPTLYGEVGRVVIEDEGETYLSLGARVALGAQGGTTFGSRSVFSVVPGL